jgi:hypothetical protein
MSDGSGSLLPPPEISPAELLGRWLPETLAANGLRPAPDAPVVRLSLSGDGGGEWTLRATEDGVDVEARAAATTARRAAGEEPQLWIRQTVADFRATFASDPDLPPLLPPGWSVLDLLFLDARDADLVRQVDGRALVEIEGRRRRRWSLDAAFGKAGVAAGRARATIRLDGDTFEGLARGDKPPLAALLEGKIKIDGDRGLATKLLLVVASRLTR